jgi:hypothetical protein
MSEELALYGVSPEEVARARNAGAMLAHHLRHAADIATTGSDLAYQRASQELDPESLARLIAVLGRMLAMRAERWRL